MEVIPCTDPPKAGLMTWRTLTFTFKKADLKGPLQWKHDSYTPTLAFWWRLRFQLVTVWESADSPEMFSDAFIVTWATCRGGFLRKQCIIHVHDAKLKTKEKSITIRLWRQHYVSKRWAQLTTWTYRMTRFRPSHLIWLLSMRRSSGSTPSPSRMTELLILSLKESPDTLRRKPISDACICELVLSVTTHSSWP